MVFGEPFARRADGADDFRAQIFFTADPIVELFRGRIVEKSVHGEIAPLRIGLGVTERDLLRMPAVAIIRLGAKRGDLEWLAVFNDDHHPEFASDGDGAFEQFFDLFRPRGRGDVVIAAARVPAENRARSRPPRTPGGRPVAGVQQSPRRWSGANVQSFTIYDLRFTRRFGKQDKRRTGTPDSSGSKRPGQPLPAKAGVPLAITSRTAQESRRSCRG